jgi:hypothetical protein
MSQVAIDPLAGGGFRTVSMRVFPGSARRSRRLPGELHSTRHRKFLLVDRPFWRFDPRLRLAPQKPRSGAMTAKQ